MATRDTYTSAGAAPTGTQFADNVAAHIKEIYDAASFPLTTIGGTANALTATLDPVLDGAGLVDGMRFTLTWGAANTGGMTLAINGGSAVPVLDIVGAALVAGAVASGLRSMIEYVGGNFRVLTALLAGGGSGGGPYHFRYTSSATWNKPAALPDDAIVIVRLRGAGGGGSSAPPGGGGGGGAFVEHMFRAADLPSSVAVSIGAGGAIDGSGGNTTFGALLTGYGGGRGHNSAGGGGGGTSGAGGAAASGTEGAAGYQGGGVGGTFGTPGASASTENGGGGGGGGNGTGAGGNGGRAVRGGGGGGGDGSTTDGTGGTSLFGGDGGNVTVAGSAPGGGGGRNAAGARGEAEIFIP